MTASEHIAYCERLVEAVERSPGSVIVCHGCGSVMGGGRLICPECEGYAFKRDPHEVTVHLRTVTARLATRPLSSGFD